MFASPAKRRKTSPTTSVAVDASNTQSNPSTPKRASFQSPTKASLARSHPNLLSKSASGSQRATRGKNLRQELLDRRTSQSAQKATPQTPKQQSQSSANQPVPAPAEGAETFSNDPRKTQATVRTPLRARQAPTRLVDAQNKDRDVQSTREAQWKPPLNVRQSRKDDEIDEPELPPTPVQLGREAPPDRPKGLGSSSPRGGSGRSRSRLNTSQSQTSSPLKPKRHAQLLNDKATAQPEFRRGAAEQPEEAPESDASHNPDEADAPAPEEVIQKRSVRDSLSAQLAHLQSDLSDLETALADSSAANANPSPELLSLLTATNPSCDPAPPIRSPSPTLDNPTILGSNPLKYLTLFAPGNIQLRSRTAASIINNRPHQTHTLELTASPPFPTHVFGATIKVSVNVEERQIVEVEVLKIRGGHQVLKSWVHKRLSSPLHKFDIGGIVWGMGRFWEECVRRARGWRALDRRFKHGDKKGSSGGAELDLKGKFEPAEVRELLKHLEIMSMTVHVPEPRRHATRSKDSKKAQEETVKTAKAQLLLVWALELDWVGEVEERMEISVTGWGQKAQDGIKEIFKKINKGKGGEIMPAMEAVWQILEKGQPNGQDKA